MATTDESTLPPLESLIRKSVKRTHTLFSAEQAFLSTDSTDKA